VPPTPLAVETYDPPTDTVEQCATDLAALAIVQEVLREPEYLHWTNIGT